MGSISEFLDMGGYAAFIWPCFGVTLAVLAVLLAVSIRGTKEQEKTLAALKESTRETDET